jgi:hypothetical protein
MALVKHQHSLSTDSTDTDGQDRFSPLLQQWDEEQKFRQTEKDFFRIANSQL